jgi:hypothetical protein
MFLKHERPFFFKPAFFGINAYQSKAFITHFSRREYHFVFKVNTIQKMS